MTLYPRWKRFLVLAVTLLASLSALPNFYGADRALQITAEDGSAIDESVLSDFEATLQASGIEYLEPELQNGVVVIRFRNIEEQLQASELLNDDSPSHVIAFTLASRTPQWLNALGLKPLSLGLDLRGGVHFLYQVDLDSSINQLLESYLADTRRELREARIRNTARLHETSIEIAIDRLEDADVARETIHRTHDRIAIGEPMQISEAEVNGELTFLLTLSENQTRAQQDSAIQANIITLRNRVNALGVSEPVVQRQGPDQIVVELPGLLDPAQAGRILGATATLEWRLQDTQNDPIRAARLRQIPQESILREDKDGNPILLRREVIASGAELTDATFGYEQGVPAVFVRLNAQGAARMLETTRNNLGRPLAVLYIEERPVMIEQNGEEVLHTTRDETVIFVGRIRGVFSNSFQVSGGFSALEAQDLALLLRSGTLAAPIAKIEERTIGPSLGQDNIESGRIALITGFLLVVAFMAAYYRVFGVVAGVALFANLLLMIGALSLLQAALTLPGIAGIVLTVGMAVDANVLIFERIREELVSGNSPQASIRAGYEKAFSTIADANVTTLIAALVLFSFGTGAIRGFAVTLSIGILTSMFTAILGTRTLIDLIYGGPRIRTLSIGGTAGTASN